MSDTTPEAITHWLRRAAAGDDSAMAQLAPLVYDSLRRIAARRLAQEGGASTWSPTELVNEAFVQLLGREPVDWRDRRHFYAYAATAMRNILVDTARRRTARKRGGGVAAMELEHVAAASDDAALALIRLDDALHALARVNARAARVVELRYFAGLSLEQTAQALGVARRTVDRDWEFARAFLHAELE